MADERRSFLQKGIGRYADACATIAHYQAELEALIVSVLEANEDWGRFRPGKTGFKGDHNRSVAERTPWIGGYVDGRLDDAKTQIELGVWWGMPSDGDVSAFCDFCEGSERVRGFAYRPAKGSGFTSFAYYDRTVVARRLTPDSDIEAELNRVLQEFLRVTGCRR